MSPQEKYCDAYVQSWIECELSAIPEDALVNCVNRIKVLTDALDRRICRHPENHDNHVKVIRHAIRMYCGVMIEIMDKQDDRKLDLSDMLLGLGKQ